MDIYTQINKDKLFHLLHLHLCQLFWAKTFFFFLIPARRFGKCSLSPQFFNSAKSRSEVLLNWGAAISNQWIRDYKYPREKKVQERSGTGKVVSLRMAGLKEKKTEPVGLKIQALGHELWASGQMRFETQRNHLAEFFDYSSYQESNL